MSLGEASVDQSGGSSWVFQPISMDLDGRLRLPRGGAIAAALLRIGLGLLYLWAFVSQGLGIGYTNSDNPDAAHPSYGWHFSYASSHGWITSGFTHSPTGSYTESLHGPLAFIPQNLPTGLDDFGWIFALAGLGVALDVRRLHGHRGLGRIRPERTDLVL